MKNFIVSILFILLFGCKRDLDGRTHTDAFWINQSSHVIEIKPYFLGSVRSQQIVRLNPGEKIQIANGMEMGKNNLGAGFYSEYMIPADSIIVTFDNIYNITHYLGTPVIDTAIKYYKNSSLHNLGNINSYLGRIDKETSISIDITYTYSFTEQDYLDAK